MFQCDQNSLSFLLGAATYLQMSFVAILNCVSTLTRCLAHRFPAEGALTDALGPSSVLWCIPTLFGRGDVSTIFAPTVGLRRCSTMMPLFC